MKILIVDDEATLKCGEIMEEFKRRQILTEVVTTQREAINKLEKDHYYDGIILDMAFPISDSSDLIDLQAGERILKELKKKHSKVPILIFSRIKALGIYPQVFDQMEYWEVEEERKKFFEFLQYL